MSTATEKRNFGTIALVTGQLMLVLLVVRQYQIESRTFFQVMALGTVGFVMHALLPLRYRLWFFTTLSLAAIVLALGVRDGVSLILLGLVLIAICHLPVSMVFRTVLLIAIGALFAVWRMQLIPAPWSVAIWPILASMFMFRLALYLYSLSHDAKRPTASQTFAYFFMMPNVCFPLYPAIDYPTFVRTYYDRDEARIYTTGMRWIVRGLIHLLLYRFVYLHLVKDPSEVVAFADLIQFMLATFLLYLRVSGQFHLIAGILHLYGFRLPETHHLYYLSSSFTDFWRRINIYWKDFMMKLVYYPSYFQLRRWGGKFAMIASTVAVFFTTWILHSYQWFWLRGGFPLALQDILFWAILGALVVVGSLRELNRPSKRSLRQSQSWSVSLALRRVGTFTVICVLWSLWSADSLDTWLTMWSSVRNMAWHDLWWPAALLVGGFIVAGKPWSSRETESSTVVPFYRLPALHSTVLLLAVLTIGTTSIYAPYAPPVASTVVTLQKSTLNSRDAALQFKGYYENLDNSSRMSAQLWDVQAKKPSHWVALAETEAYRVRADFLKADLRPDVHITFEDQPLTTNHWGMRDRDRSLNKPEGTYRIALLGPSHIMGSGVADNETISVFLEAKLNQSNRGVKYKKYEVLNFGVAGYSLMQQLAMIDDRVMNFQPDAVFVTDSSGLIRPIVNHLANVIGSHIDVPYADLANLIRPAEVESLGNPGYPVPFARLRAIFGAIGIQTRMPGREGYSRLSPLTDSVVSWSFMHMASVSREHGAVPVFVALEIVQDPPRTEVAALKDANAAGFLVFNLFDIWANRDKSSLRLGEWDDHPNAAGNRVIAERLFQLISEHRSELHIAPDSPELYQEVRAER